MKFRFFLACVLVVATLLSAAPAKAQTNVIIRTTNLAALQTLCAIPLTPCTVVGGLGDPLGQVFLVTSPLPLQTLLGALQSLTGFVDAEVDQVLSLVGGLNVVPTSVCGTAGCDPTLMSDRTPVVYPPGSGNTAWNSYVNQPASGVVRVQTAQSQFSVTGVGIVADIDTGVDPNHPVLKPVLLQGYDFIHKTPGASEMNDLSPSFPPPSCTATCPSPAQVNQSSVAILDQSSVAILDTSQYSAFGHGTMVMGIIHLVAPTAQLLPLKTFNSNGTANLSDILSAIYYATQNGANVINMSFDTKTASTELSNALNYATGAGVICAASSGNDGVQELVYPAALQNDVMGVASVGSTSSTDTARSSFSNYGSAIVWVAAPGEQIVTTYPFSTYAAGWGTSFSAPFVSGGAALLRNLSASIDEAQAAAAVANAAPLDPALQLNHGRLDLVPALQSLSGTTGTPDYTVLATPPSQTVTAGQSTTYTVKATPAHGFNKTITWSCSGQPALSTCTVSPSSTTLDGTNAATATVTLQTTGSGLMPPLAPPSVPQPQMHFRMTVTAILAWIALILLLWRLSKTPTRRRGLAAAAGVVAISLYLYSCGGAGYVSGNPPPVPPAISSVSLNPSSVTGGSPSSGTATLNGAAPSEGAVVSLSSNSNAATVPANVTIDAGATSATFSVTTSAVTTSTLVTITASYGVAKTASLTVEPPGTTPATLSSVVVNPTSVTGGSPSSGMVSLTKAAPTGGSVVSLSSNSSSAKVPATVTVGAGATSATFSVTTSAVSTSTTATITASYGGVTKTAMLAVAPSGSGPVMVSSVAFSPGSVTGGSPSTGKVTLTGAAPTGGAIVSLSSNSSSATVPATVTVAAGATSATFSVTTSAVTTSTTATITAVYGGGTATGKLTLTPPGTPGGTYTLTITGTSESLSHSTTVQVTVN